MNRNQATERTEVGENPQTARRRARIAVISGCVVAGCIIGSAGSAQAQFVVGPTWGGWGQSVGTAEGSYLQGSADVIRSEGAYNLYTAQAMVQYEQARSQYLNNRREATKTYLASRELYQAQQKARRERARASAEVAREIRVEGPSPLGPDSFDRDSGKLMWPKALRDSQYARKRSEIERLFQQESQATVASREARNIKSIAAEMATLLKNNISKLPANEYLQARKFLDRLAVTEQQG